VIAAGYDVEQFGGLSTVHEPFALDLFRSRLLWFGGLRRVTNTAILFCLINYPFSVISAPDNMAEWLRR